MLSTIFSKPSVRHGQKRLGNNSTEALAATVDAPTSNFGCAIVLSLLTLLSLFIIHPSAMAAKNSDPDKVQKAAAMPFGAFGSLEFKTNATTGLSEWRRFQKRSKSERVLYANCAASVAKCPQHLRAWGSKVTQWRLLSKLSQINAVNSWINGRIHYTEDLDIFGVADRWATLSYAMKGRGDCEDFALAKYETLRSLGFSEDSLRLVVVKDTRKKIGHAVLTVALDGGLYVLDNQIRRTVRHETINHYVPVFSVNATGRWINIATRKIKSKYQFALKPDRDPAIASATGTRIASVIDVPLSRALRLTIVESDASVAVLTPATTKPLLGAAARELP